MFRNILSENFDLDLVLSNSGIIINMVPNIVENKEHRSNKFVAATSCLDLLLEKFHDFKLVVNYELFEPTEARKEPESTRSTAL